MWIFCEGEKTEKLYFEKLRFDQRIQRLSIKIHASKSDKAVNELLEYSIKFIEHHKRDFYDDDLVLCVFDRDANTNKDIERAIQIAKRHNIGLIFSNPSFEYWILCHFGYFSNRFEQASILKKLDELMNKYRKNDPKLYEKTIRNIYHAISNSKRILEEHVNANIPPISVDSNPCTMVFEIIEKIDEFR